MSILDDEPLPVVEAVPRDATLRLRGPLRDRPHGLHLPRRAAPGRDRAAQELALRTYRLLGCPAFARVDLMLDPDGELTVLETNPIPGLTETSLLPQAADAAGISRSTS